MSKQSTIQHYFSLTPAGVPAGAGMTYGEIAINVADEKLFIENLNGDVIPLSQTKDLSGAFANRSQVASSVYGITGDVLLVAGTNVSLTSSGKTVTISVIGLSAAASDFVTQGKLDSDFGVTGQVDNTVPFVDDFDPQGWWNATTRQFKPNISGYYDVSYGAWFSAGTTSVGQANIQIRKNGSTFLISQSPLVTSSDFTLEGTKSVFLNGSTDYVDFTVYTSQTPSQTLKYGGTSFGTGTWFRAFLLSNNTPPTAYVSSLNGATGAVTDVAKTNTAQTFTGLQTFANGISGAGATFASDITINGIRVGKGAAGDLNSIVVGMSACPAGTFNVAIGREAMRDSASAINNVAIGYHAARDIQGGVNNVAIGANALDENENGSVNVAVGSLALSESTNSNQNTAIGSSSLQNTTTGFRNVGIGYQALEKNISGVANVAIGHAAGAYRGDLDILFPNDLDNEEPNVVSNRTTGTGGIYIGQWSRASANGQTNEIVIGTNAVGLGSNTAVIGATAQASATIYGTLNLPGGLSSASNSTLSGVRIVNEGIYWNGSQRTVGVSFLNGQVQTLTGIGSGATGMTAIYFVDAPSTGAASVTVIITNGGQMTGNQDFWSSKIEWPGGVKPSLSLGGVDVVSFLTVDGGTNIYGFLGGLNFL